MWRCRLNLVVENQNWRFDLSPVSKYGKEQKILRNEISYHILFLSNHFILKMKPYL